MKFNYWRNKMSHSIAVRLNKELYDFIKSHADTNNSSIYSMLSTIVEEYKKKLSGEDFDLNDISLEDLFETEEEIEQIEQEENENQKDHRVKVKFITSEKTKSAIQKLAKENYISMNKYIDIFLTNHVENDKVRYTESELRLLHQYNYEIRAVGRNLNQITKQINSGKLKILDEYIVELIEEVNDKIIEYSSAIKDIVIRSNNTLT
jgi:mobC